MTSNNDRLIAQLRHVAEVAVVYGAFLMCTSVLLWGGYLGVLPALFGTTYRAVGYFSCGFTFVLGFSAVAGITYARPAMRAWRHPLVPLALVIVAGGLLATQIHTGTDSILLGAIIGGLLGFASALFFCALQEMVSALHVFDCGFAVFAAAAVSAVLYLLLLPLPHDVAVWLVLFVCLPIVTIAYAIVHKGGRTSRPHPMFQSVPSNNPGRLAQATIDLWRPLLCVSFSALLIGIIRSDTLLYKDSLVSANNAGMIGLLIAAVVLLVFWRDIYRRTLLSKLQLLIFPLVATSFLLLPFLSGAARGGFVAFAFVVFSITSSLMVVACARTARTYAIQPVLVYGVFAGVVYLFLISGTLLAFSLGGLAGNDTLWLFAVALVAIYTLSMTLTFGKRMIRRGRREQSDQDEKSEQMPQFLPNQAHSPASSSVSQSGSDPIAEPTFEQRCTAVSRHYTLTPREAEVMSLLAHGRDVIFIAEKLVLSKNTVRTHVKSVFSKTGVHSKQELIDLVTFFEI